MPCYRTPFRGVIQWPHLDFGSIGREKQFGAVDLVADAPRGVSISIGYDQRNLNARTPDYLVDPDTLPGQPVPIPVGGPSFDLRLTFEPGQRWKWSSAVMQLA